MLPLETPILIESSSDTFKAATSRPNLTVTGSSLRRVQPLATSATQGMALMAWCAEMSRGTYLSIKIKMADSASKASSGLKVVCSPFKHGLNSLASQAHQSLLRPCCSLLTQAVISPTCKSLSNSRMAAGSLTFNATPTPRSREPRVFRILW